MEISKKSLQGIFPRSKVFYIDLNILYLRGGRKQIYSQTDIRSSYYMNFEECYKFCRSRTAHIRSITIDREYTFSKGQCFCHTNEPTFVNKEYVNLKDRYSLLPFGSSCSFESVPTCK